MLYTSGPQILKELWTTSKF